MPATFGMPSKALGGPMQCNRAALPSASCVVPLDHAISHLHTAHQRRAYEAAAAGLVLVRIGRFAYIQGAAPIKAGSVDASKRWRCVERHTMALGSSAATLRASVARPCCQYGMKQGWNDFASVVYAAAWSLVHSSVAVSSCGRRGGRRALR